MSNPTGPWGSPPEQPDAAGSPPQTPGYGAQPPTVYPGYQQPGQGGGYGDAGSSGGYGGYGGGSGGSGGSGGYGGYGGSTPPPKPRSPWLWFLGGAATAVVVMVAIGAVVLVSVGGFDGLAGDDDEPSPDVADDTSSPLVPGESDSDTPTVPGESDTPDVDTPTIPTPTTEDENFDELIAACEGGSMSDCDDLYLQTPVGSEEEEFGSTCALQIGETRGHCEDWAAFTRPASGSPDFDARFDRLWTSCENGDMAECDDLWRETPVDSVYEAFGSTCAGRTEETSGDCEETITYLP